MSEVPQRRPQRVVWVFLRPCIGTRRGEPPHRLPSRAISVSNARMPPPSSGSPRPGVGRWGRVRTVQQAHTATSPRRRMYGRTDHF